MKRALHFSWTMMVAGAMKTACSSFWTRLCFPRATLYCFPLLEAHRSKGFVSTKKSCSRKPQYLKSSSSSPTYPGSGRGGQRLKQEQQKKSGNILNDSSNGFIRCCGVKHVLIRFVTFALTKQSN